MLEASFDKFDTFFFNALYYYFPKTLLESFKDNFHKIENELIKYSKLKAIISENWIGDSKNSLLLAIAKECFNVKIVTNEHNCFFHIYEGSFSNYLIGLSDIFITLGWKSKNKKVLRGGSIFRFKLGKIILKLKFYLLQEAYYIRNLYFHHFIQIVVIPQ